MIEETIDFRQLNKIFVSEEIDGYESGIELLLIGYGFTDKYGIKMLKEMWKTVDLDEEAIGRDKKMTMRLCPADMGGCITLLDITPRRQLKVRILAEMNVVTPMGLCYDDMNNQLLVGGAKSVLTIKGGKLKDSLRNNLFSQVHVISKTSKGYICANTNTDSIVEFDPRNSTDSIWEWLATENGFLENRKGVQRKISREINYQIREDYGTMNHTTHINSVLEYREDRVLATLFHQGQLILINKKDGSHVVVFDGMKNPHGVHKTSDGYIVSDTRGGRVVLFDEDLNYKDSIKGDFDWIQDAIEFKDYYVVGNDNNYRLELYDKNLKQVSSISWGKDSRKISSLTSIKAKQAWNVFKER